MTTNDQAVTDERAELSELQAHRQAGHQLTSLLIGLGVFEIEEDGGAEVAWNNIVRAVKRIAESQAVAGSIRVDIENVGICDIPVRDGVAYMPAITVADIVKRAQPAPVDGEVERDAARYRYIIQFSTVQTAVEALLGKDTLFGPEFDEAIYAAQQQEVK